MNYFPHFDYYIVLMYNNVPMCKKWTLKHSRVIGYEVSSDLNYSNYSQRAQGKRKKEIWVMCTNLSTFEIISKKFPILGV